MTSALAMLALVGGASAGGPVIQTQTVTAVNVPWGPSCGSERIRASFTATRRSENFYDGSTLVLQRRHVTGAGTITLPSTGRSLPYEVDFTITFDFAAHTATITGQQAHVIVPDGGGVIFRNSGRLVEDISQFPPPIIPPIIEEAGLHDYFDPGGLDRVCAALGA